MKLYYKIYGSTYRTSRILQLLYFRLDPHARLLVDMIFLGTTKSGANFLVRTAQRMSYLLRGRHLSDEIADL